MPKICGVYDFKGRKISAFEIDLGLQSLSRSKDKGKFSILIIENSGLGQHQFSAKNSYSSIEYSSGENDKKKNIVADSVLTNQSELFPKLSIPQSERYQITDNQIILKAYEKWGEDCPNHLAGSFAFAICDTANKKIFCSRDQFGGSTFFFYKNKERFIFASEPHGILSFKNVEKIFNKNKLAVLLLPEPHTYLTNESWFENIFPLPAGSNLIVDKSGVKIRKYYQPKYEKKTYKSDGEVLEEFRELFLEIIGAHLKKNPPAASLLSGGLDSSSIVSAAAQILKTDSRKMDVFAGVLPDINDANFSDERYFIDQFKDFSNIRINYISVPETGPFSNLDEIFANFFSPFLTSRHYLYTSFCKKAVKTGAKTLLEGSFGEMGATTYARGGFAEMFVGFNWLKLFKELYLRKKMYGDSILYNLRSEVLNPLIPKFLINLKRGKDNVGFYTDKSRFFKENFASNLLRNINFAENLPKRISSNHRENQIIELDFTQQKSSEGFSLNFTGEPIEVRYPFLDKRLIEFSLGVPVNLKIKNGHSRYLIRAGLDKILPPEIQWRTTKIPFSPDYLRRYNSQIGEVRKFLKEIKKNDPVREILDIEKLENWANLPVADSERSTASEKIARDYLPQAIYLIYFLRTFSEFRL